MIKYFVIISGRHSAFIFLVLFLLSVYSVVPNSGIGSAGLYFIGIFMLFVTEQQEVVFGTSS